MNPKLSELRRKAMQLPLTPGVYLMKNSRSEIIYVGKAKALKNRVSQYFGSQNNHTVKVRKMVENVDDFDVILTDSEFEALVLECSLIKQHSPKYNILLKDDKGYSYIKVTSGKWRNIYAVLQRDDDDASYIGPYTSSFAVRNTVDEAKKIFRLPQCNKVFPRDFGKSRPCLNYFIGQCSGVCSGKVPFEQYDEAVSDALAFIKDGGTKAIADLQQRMEKAAEELEFEKAARLRDRIAAIKRLGGKQKVMSAEIKEQDIFALVTGASSSGKACLSVLRFADGRLYDSENFITDAPENTAETMEQLIRSFYLIRDFVPKRVSVECEIADSELLERWLSKKKGKRVIISHSTAGEQKKLFEMCRSNAAQYLAPLTGASGRKTAALDELAGLLGLSAAPEFIEAYDISHTAGSDNVAGMVVFRNGEPYKKGYRRFIIKGFTGQDDYASMAEVLDRRLTRYEEEKESGEGFGRLPDLILLDGGKGQVSAVEPILKKHSLENIPLFGMVKDGSHRTRAIAMSGGEIALSSKRRAFTLVAEIQEEVHRFAVTYHRQKHKSSALSGTLTEIPGVGPARAKALLRHFKTITAIKKAGIDELKSVPGISDATAQTIYDALHK
ncbi:MAG: excinuclease ABC subunit UvrC [Acutalibacteraceae bacterium]